MKKHMICSPSSGGVYDALRSLSPGRSGSRKETTSWRRICCSDIHLKPKRFSSCVCHASTPGIDALQQLLCVCPVGHLPPMGVPCDLGRRMYAYILISTAPTRARGFTTLFEERNASQFPASTHLESRSLSTTTINGRNRRYSSAPGT